MEFSLIYANAIRSVLLFYIGSKYSMSKVSDVITHNIYSTYFWGRAAQSADNHHRNTDIHAHANACNMKH